MSLLLRAGVFGVAMSGVALLACSSAPTDPVLDVGSVGSVSLPLTAQSGDVLYRLASAKFTITGPALGNKPRVVTPPADTPIDQETLPVGSYAIVLENGWHLQKKGPMDTAFSDIPAQLVVENPQKFDIARNAITNVIFSFGTGLGTVDLGRGTANIRIEARDCSAFNSYAASLATFTVKCLGTIDQFSYMLNAAGFLQRNFKECKDPATLQSIDDFLGLQYPVDSLAVNPLPFAQECVAGRWAQWKQSFDDSGVTQCPTWTKIAEQNTPTPELYDRFAKLLPPLPFAETGERQAIATQIKINSLYTVTFGGAAPPTQKCETPAACAVLCAGGFPGFVVRSEGTTVQTDPPPWQSDTIYTSSNPFLRPGYYHPMSFYGPPPGELFAHYNRGIAPEKCSYYQDGFHFQTFLKQICRDMPDGTTSCVSTCVP